MLYKNLNSDHLSALNNDTRTKILEKLWDEPDYPASTAKKLNISKQKAHYHFKKLSETGLIKQIGTKKVSGGAATYYKPTTERFVYSKDKLKQSKFLNDFFIEDSEGLIVVGAPDSHGPDQVRARDGHLAGDIGVKLGSIGGTFTTVWDTEVIRDKMFDHKLVLVGGVLTNTVTKKFNEEFPAYFSGESFPYREITTPNSTYTDPDTGLIAKTNDKILVAGVRNTGTKAAVKAFIELTELKKDYLVVKGLDLDGDGEIDDYEVIE